jgi:hypothetical protein
LQLFRIRIQPAKINADPDPDGKNDSKIEEEKNSVSDPDPDWIGIQSGQWSVTGSGF